MPHSPQFLTASFPSGPGTPPRNCAVSTRGASVNANGSHTSWQVPPFTPPAPLAHTLSHGAWPWALADLAFACTGLALLGVAHKLRPRPAAAAQCAPRTQGADLPPAPSAAPGG